MQFWSDDEHTRVIGMYTETFGNPRRFVRIARRVSRTRPIVAVRAGAAMGPTGSALYEQAGLIEVPTVQALLDTARVLTAQPVPTGPNVAVVGNARSPVALAMDALTAVGLCPRRVGADLRFMSPVSEFARLRPRCACRRRRARRGRGPRAPLTSGVAEPLEAIEQVAADSPKPVVAVLLGAPDGVAPGHHIPVFAFSEPAAAALGRMYAYHRWLESEAASEPVPVSDIDRPAGGGADRGDPGRR